MTPYPIANVLIVCLITAVLLWLFNTFTPNTAPETQKAKTIINVVVCVILAIWIVIYMLGGFTVFGR